MDLLYEAIWSGQQELPYSDVDKFQRASLPNLCCQAAGGDPLWAEDLTAAWLLFFRAAQIMDHVEDQDLPEAWWLHRGAGVAINAASGLYFTASQILQSLYMQEATRLVAREVIEYFYSSLLHMCGGQHRDLAQQQLSLEQCWEIAAAKSGTFFALACRAGARLGTGEACRLEAFGCFGHYLGLLVQVLDDLEELRLLQVGELAGRAIRFDRSLPVAYALEVLPSPERAEFQESLQEALMDKAQARQAFHWIDQSGAGLYLRTEIERLHQRALSALDLAEPLSPAKEELLGLLEQKTHL